jgi:flagellar basal-body rod protein FlgG
MIRALWTGSTGMQSQQTNIDVIANNLANVNTAGFKRGRADFQDLLYQTIRLAGTTVSAGNEVPTGIQIGHGSRVAAVQDIYLQGDFKQTYNELDLTIEGKGFFQIIKADGEIAFTRSGAFKIDSDGRIVNSDGLPLEPEITIPDDTVQITIGPDGTVSVLQAADTAPTEVGNIELVMFPNQAGLRHLGRNLLDETDASGAPITGTPGEDGFGSLAQGFLEMSNVSVVEEMVNMIVSQRAYEINSKVIQASDDMLQVANNLKR